MNIELYVAIMAGFVLSFFLMVSEVVFMRKRLIGILTHLRHLYRTGAFMRLMLSVCALAGFFLIQPLIIGFLVVMALDNSSHGFYDSVIREIRHGVTGLFG
jgi:hypothetical protein